MPVYEYECPSCGILEIMQKFTDPVLQRCPNCKKKVKKLISLSSFHLKGSGWYATDYAGKGNGNGKGKTEQKDDFSRSGKEPEKSSKETVKESSSGIK